MIITKTHPQSLICHRDSGISVGVQLNIPTHSLCGLIFCIYKQVVPLVPDFHRSRFIRWGISCGEGGALSNLPSLVTCFIGGMSRSMSLPLYP